MDSAVERFEMRITIDPSDQMGHVNNVVYLRWVQDAAEYKHVDLGIK